ncbi:type IX secretion system periplasmic lipoprotein PorW/SprE [Neolewinella litorea]|uniref:Tetratricopeptide repeat protein n=1 Tax=Neolewinella litorea TaxID=2562452 RepID=A0A4S4NCX3_9BACT|nr:tetratricopeptide repeat protein [Neolewinella litorea]THH36357.1 tetratricopeptide repeat protein [Neolewinella litorea]
MRLTQLFLILLALQVLVSACSPTKRREDQGIVAKAWHNTNAHFNGYFNAREIMDETLLALNEQHEDNYNQRLEMFPFLAVDNPSTAAGELDRAIEKVAIVVKKHPFSNWTDDSYLLVGQAQLLKQDYESAERTLDFALSEFRPRPKRGKSKSTSDDEGEEEFESRREVEASKTQTRRDRLRARREAQRERERTIKQRQKEQKVAQKQRERERRAKIRARKKGIRLPSSRPAAADSTALAGLENEPDTPETEAEMEEGPIGMISIFSNRSADEAGSGEYGSNPGSYLLKHRPAYQEIRLWLAWTLIKRDDFDRAQIILEDLRNDRGTYADVRRKAIAVQAYLYLEQDRLEEAIPYLEAAAEVAEERNEQARYSYIAGQLYQELGQPGSAIDAFRAVVAAKPAYELELGARINMAQNAYLSGSGSPAEALRDLERMAGEEKNREYESQILYAMAGIALNSGDEAAGAEYLRRALDSPYGGSNTRVEAYQLLGDMAYTQEDYLTAKNYYDSTLQVMAETDVRFPETSGRRDRLTGVSDNLQAITVKDSLLRIGMLPDADRRNWAEEVFELRRATSSAANFSTPVTRGSLPVTNASATVAVTGSSFWGYDNQAIRRGRRDFARRWGDRPLEDNWRRSSRTDVSLFTDAGDAGVADPAAESVTLVTEDEINRILADVPTDEATQAATRAELAEAYFNLGREYRDRVNNNAKAIDAFETLDERFPGTAFEPESWYYLYLLHKAEGNTAEARTYADRLAQRYGETKFARLANDPNFVNELADEESGRNRAYEAAYAAFENRDYADARRRILASVGSLPEDHALRARYDLLNAMVSGKLEGRAAYVSALQQVVNQYNNTPEQTRAREILRLLGESAARVPGRTETTAGTSFQASMDEIHYVLIVFENTDARLNDLKIELENFNQQYNKLDRLKSTPIYIGRNNETPMLVMRRFRDGNTAMEYYRSTQQNSQDFLANSGEGFQVLPVSQTNYREILKARSIAGYADWFRANYQ